jgi:hypothetical protein
MTVDTLPVPTDSRHAVAAVTARGVALAEHLNATVHCCSTGDERIASGLDSVQVVEDSMSVDRLTERAEDRYPSMTVMDTHGPRGFQRAVVGSTTGGVVRLASVPEMTVYAGGNESERESDGSETA